MYLQINSYPNWKIGTYIDILVHKTLFKNKLFSRMTTLPPVCCVFLFKGGIRLCVNPRPCWPFIAFWFCLSSLVLNPNCEPYKSVSRLLLLLLLPTLGVNSGPRGISATPSLTHIRRFHQETTPSFCPSLNEACFHFTFLSFLHIFEFSFSSWSYLFYRIYIFYLSQLN